MSAGLRLRDRLFSAPRQDAPPGLLSGPEAGIESRLVDTRRHRLDAVAPLRGGPALDCVPADGELRYEGILSRPEDLTVQWRFPTTPLSLGPPTGASRVGGTKSAWVCASRSSPGRRFGSITPGDISDGARALDVGLSQAL